MSLRMVGVSHHTAPLEIRERLVFEGERLAEAARQWRRSFPGSELVLVSTCNRTEFYMACASGPCPRDAQVTAFLAEICGLSPEALAPVLVSRDHEEAVSHLFSVASGLESMVLGEPQVLGQVKRAYEQAQGHDLVGKTLHQFFQRALAVAKRVRTDTDIGAGRISVGSVGADLARQIFQRFDDKTVVGIGAGEMTKLMLRHLCALSPARMWVVNRSVERARALAATLGIPDARGGGRPLDDLDALLVEADIVLTATGSPQPIVTASSLRGLARRRRHRPLFLIDIALPRDVEPAVGSLRDVFLYDLDDLQQVVAQTGEHRQDHAHVARQFVAEATTTCVEQMAREDLGRVIGALRRRLHEVGRQESDRTHRKLATAPADQVPALLDEQTHRLINKILHMPLSALNGRNRPPPQALVEAIRQLFQIDDEP